MQTAEACSLAVVYLLLWLLHSSALENWSLLKSTMGLLPLTPALGTQPYCEIQSD